MIRKLSVISALTVLLVYTVFKMIKYEEHIRATHIITHVVKDERQALLPEISPDEFDAILKRTRTKFKAGKDYFLIRNENEQWQRFPLKGVNMGVALPGKFPAEFSMTYEQYYDWIKKIGRMHANIIRTYTILPPEFYNALADYNLRHADKPVFLLQGVWADIPKNHDYHDYKYTRNFKKEIINVIDVLHGNAVMKPQPGKAHGVYVTDVSRYVTGLLLGREWEPDAVYQTVKQNSGKNHFNGKFISLPHGNPMEVWLAQMLDFAVEYETRTYRTQHPVSFVNWLPLDPMFHDTEFIENKKVREYDNDLVSVDFSRFNATENLKAGLYAAYHVYPYYPDFIFLNPKYRDTLTGRNDNFRLYLEDLKAHTPGMPLVIAEYGLPNSRGISHFAPSGFHQGGHSELQQAALVSRLTRDIMQTGCAGAIYFEWADEWFKHNWLVMDFEIPAENRKLWHNKENPEQNFGILALEDQRKQIDGKDNDWQNDLPVWKNNKAEIYGAADATYFYLAARMPRLNFRQHNLYIALDTYDPEKGDRKLPFSDTLFSNGFEFLARFLSTRKADLLVDEPYSVFTDIYNDHIPVYASQPNANGKFIPQLMLTNRKRESLTGTVFDSVVINRSPLQFGNSGQAGFSNADWYWKDGFFELRLDWHLLNVSDPSGRKVLDDRPGTPQIEIAETEAIRVYFILTDKNNRIIDIYPPDRPAPVTWDKWTQPRFTQRLKPLYDTLRNLFVRWEFPEKSTKQFTDQEDFLVEITPFAMDKNAAVSLSFEGGFYAQYRWALPLLEKYRLQAGFSLDPLHTAPMTEVSDYGGLFPETEKNGWTQWRAIARKKHELMLIYRNEQSINRFRSHLQSVPEAIHTVSGHKPGHPAVFQRPLLLENKAYQYQGISYLHYTPTRNTGLLDRFLNRNQGKWMIVVYRGIYKDSLEIQKFSAGVKKKFFIDYEQFRRQIRLIRNKDYWVAPESEVYAYLKAKKSARILTRKAGNIHIVHLQTPDFHSEKPVVLTLKIYTKARIIRVWGSEADGTYQNKEGFILVPLKTGNTMKVETIK